MTYYWKMFTSFFGGTKNVIIGLLGALFLGYTAKEKYKLHKATSKLKTIEHKIAEQNVKNAKAKAKALANSKEIETDTEIEVLKELHQSKEAVVQEMIELEKNIAQETNNVSKEGTEVKGRTRGKPFKVKR